MLQAPRLPRECRATIAGASSLRPSFFSGLAMWAGGSEDPIIAGRELLLCSSHSGSSRRAHRMCDACPVKVTC